MGGGVPQNVFGSAGGYKFGKNLVFGAVKATAFQLAVRKGAGTAFSELHITFGIQGATRKKGINAAHAFFHSIASLQNNGTGTRLSQHQGGKETARTASYNDGTSVQLSVGEGKG